MKKIKKSFLKKIPPNNLFFTPPKIIFVKKIFGHFFVSDRQTYTSPLYKDHHHRYHHRHRCTIIIIIIQAFLSYDCEAATLTDSLTGEVVPGDGDVYLLRSLSPIIMEIVVLILS